MAVIEQINHWYDEERPETLRRGSAITGKSTDNCRMEYIWRYVGAHVTKLFREVFNMMRQVGILNVDSKVSGPVAPCPCG